jgi:hypothetical protein
MKKMPINRDVPEDLVPRAEATPAASDRGVVSYRCKVFKTMLDITSESDFHKGPLVLRSRRWIASARTN